jgi:hypothetical protein
MRVVCISDTHNQHNSTPSIPDGDILLHAGDITGIGKREEVKSFFEWAIKEAKRFTYGIAFIAGNHDRCFDPKFGEYDPEDEYKEGPRRKPKWLVDALHNLKFGNTGVHYLEDSWIEVGSGEDKLKIWGSPYSPWFHGDRWAFNAHRGEDIRNVWDEISMTTDILMTHTPVSYKLDYVPRSQEYVGCEDLHKVVTTVKPIMHVCGHIHEGYGLDYNLDTTFVNASICNEYYNPTNEPWVFDIVGKEVTAI